MSVADTLITIILYGPFLAWPVLTTFALAKIFPRLGLDWKWALLFGPAFPITFVMWWPVIWLMNKQDARR